MPEVAAEFINVQVEPELKRDLEKLAEKNERTLSGEVRRALRVWVFDHEMPLDQESR